MANNLYNTMYNPDVLSCIANLSNDEVFTPPEVANAMLDLLPRELFADPDVTFLDPACKTGVFLREIAKRLIKGLEPVIPDLDERLDHIYKKQLFGIAITELTSYLARRSLYCSKFANGRYSVVDFENVDGNVRYKNIQHQWKDGKCVFCGASQKEYDRDAALETHAYEWIHTTKPEEIFNMKFDVIISNPPYQLSTTDKSKQAKPLYHLFIKQAMKLKPRFLSMIIPSRWFSGGMGLDAFRSEMLQNKNIRKLVDFPNSHDVFSGVDVPGGVCYFLWDRDNEGPCEVVNIVEGKEYSNVRYLDEFSSFVRSSQAIPIIRKILDKEKGKPTLDTRVSTLKPFGLPTNYTPRKTGVPCWFVQKIGLQYADPADIKDANGYLQKWKLLLPPAPIAGQTDFNKPVGFYYDGNTRIARPGECCTESWMVAGAFDTEEEVLSFKSYIFTKTVRFLLLQTVVSQHVNKKYFCFIPDLCEYTGMYSDALLRTKWSITDEEWAFIDSRIHNYGDNC